MQITKKYLFDKVIEEGSKVLSEAEKKADEKYIDFLCGRVNMLVELLDEMESDIKYENLKRWKMAGEK